MSSRLTIAQLLIRNLLCGLLFFALIPSTHAQPADQSPPTAPQLIAPDYASLQTGIVTRVLDQNTLLVDLDDKPTRIDLLGVSGTTKPQNPDQIRLAIETLSRIALGETVLIQNDPSGELNRANKRVAYLFRAPDHLFINLELVRQGHTRYTSNAMTIHTALFEHYEQRAQQLQRGIWGPDLPTPLIVAPEQDTDTPTDTHQPAQRNDTVYITAHGSKYHRKDCPHLTDTTRTTTRDKVESTHQPCKTCKPDAP